VVPGHRATQKPAALWNPASPASHSAYRPAHPPECLKGRRTSSNLEKTRQHCTVTWVSSFPPATPPTLEALEHPQSTPETLLSTLWSHRFWVLCSCLALLQVLLVLDSSLYLSFINAFQAVERNTSVSKMNRDIEIGKGPSCLPDNLARSGRISQQQCQDFLL